MAIGDILSKGINYAIIGLLFYYVFIDESQRVKHYTKSVSEQTELTRPGKLLNSTYQLEEHGFSKKYVKELNADKLYSPIFGLQKFNQVRFKKFEHYSVQFGDKILQVAAADVFIGGNIFVIVYDYETKEIIYENKDLLPIIDKAQFPELADNVFACAGSYTSEKGGLRVKVHKQKVADGICRTDIEVSAKDKVEASFTLNRSMNDEDIYTIVPITEDNKYFYYNLKAYHISCSGTYNGEKVNDALCASDYGRGLFPYKTNWIWSTATGKTGDKTISLELGGGIAAVHTNGLDDAFKVDDKVFKLNPVEYTYDKLNYMNGFTMRTHEKFAGDKNNAAEIVFRTNYVHKKKDNLIIIKSNMDYIYGTYSGWVTDDNGVKYEFENIRGLTEVAKFKW